jgi:hypothetical protein
MALFSKIQSFFSHGKKSQIDEGPDLFDYAKQDLNSDTHTKEKGNDHKKILIPVLLILTGIMSGAVVACLLCSGNHLNKSAIIYLSDGTEMKGKLNFIKPDNLKFTTIDDSEVKIIDMISIKRIDFLSDESAESAEKNPPPASDSVRELTEDEKRFLGQYSADISGHKADLTIFKMKNGYPGASLRFQSWGTGQVHYMRGVRVSGRTIFFKRQCEAELCRKLGSPNIINQDFSGDLSANNIEIQGSYLGGQNASRWSAKRR